MALSVVSSNLTEVIKASYALDNGLLNILHKLRTFIPVEQYSSQDQCLRRSGKLAIGPDSNLRFKIINWLHSSPESGHSRREFIKRVKSLFYWKKLIKEVRQFLKRCVVCQASKYNLAAKPGLLQPLPIPKATWVDISMDFITRLSNSGGYEIILVVVDKLRKYAHFMLLARPYTTLQVAQTYLDNVSNLHG